MPNSSASFRSFIWSLYLCLYWRWWCPCSWPYCSGCKCAAPATPAAHSRTSPTLPRASRWIPPVYAISCQCWLSWSSGICWPALCNRISCPWGWLSSCGSMKSHCSHYWVLMMMIAAGNISTIGARRSAWYCRMNVNVCWQLYVNVCWQLYVYVCWQLYVYVYLCVYVRWQLSLYFLSSSGAG